MGGATHPFSAPPTHCAEGVSGSRLAATIDSYELNLLSHLELAKSLKSAEAAVAQQTVYGVLDSAQKLVEQFSLLKSQLASSNISNNNTAGMEGEESHNNRKIHPASGTRRSKMNVSESKSESMKDSSSSTSTNETRNPAPQKPRSGLKRSWADDDSGREEKSDRNDDVLKKRARTKRKIPGATDDVNDFVPVALQKEDISEEVERRLRLREEKREKRNQASVKKRKRDSNTSKEGIIVTKAETLINKRHKTERIE